jgi:hypothetical protein
LERIRVEGRKVRVDVNPKFYNYETVLKTANTFDGICKTSVKQFDDCIVVFLQPKSKKTNIKNLGYEFYNHLLNTTKEINLGLA